MVSLWNNLNQILEEQLSENNKITEVLNKIENITNVKKAYIIKGE